MLFWWGHQVISCHCVSGIPLCWGLTNHIWPPLLTRQFSLILHRFQVGWKLRLQILLSSLQWHYIMASQHTDKPIVIFNSLLHSTYTETIITPHNCSFMYMGLTCLLTPNALIHISYRNESSYNAVQYNMILHTSLQWLRQTIYQSFNPQKTTLTSPQRASYGVIFVRIWELFIAW